MGRPAAVLTRCMDGATVKERGLDAVDYPAGWTCERTVVQLQHYLLSTLPLRDALAIAEHLEACDGCSHRLVLYRLTVTERSRG